jgi:GTPase SAR1 family protein
VAIELYNAIKDGLLDANHKIVRLFQQARAIPGMADHNFGDWETTCERIGTQMEEEIVRVAVVGSVKSGKSTFVNALFKGDHLKRGAGVVTSIVTRIRSGSALRAKLFFKSWDEVNAEMEQALVLFPSLNWLADQANFDIRRQKDRHELQRALKNLSADQLITGETLNVNSVLLKSYLEGYGAVAEIISVDTEVREYTEVDFAEQRRFVGNDNLAVYLKDVELNIDHNHLGRDIEIADCQGSDSPNPLHLAMIQDYLLITHLIIYVVSSRTGLRQADIKFLSMIKNMGIMENILFVINSDFSEHDSLSNLKHLAERVRGELSLLKPEPEIFTFSALFNLFAATASDLSVKDRLRLEQWQKETAFVEFSDLENKRFAKSFTHKLTGERYALLLKNHLERMAVIVGGIQHWIRINQDILSKDRSSADVIIDRLKQHKMRMDQVKAMIRSTLDGAVNKIKQELKAEIDRFFDPHSSRVMESVITFIRHYTPVLDPYYDTLETSGFANTLYLVFQQFKQSLDRHMAETINPEIVKFTKKIEKETQSQLVSIAGPYDAMVRDAQNEYNQSLGLLEIHLELEDWPAFKLQDLNVIKEIIGLKLPAAVATMHYSARIKTEAVMRLGVYTFARLLRKVLKKPYEDKKEEGIRALKDGVRRMKQETESSIIAHFKDYAENIKFQYVFKLVDALATSLYEGLLDRFQTYFSDHTRMVGLIGEQRLDREQASGALETMGLAADDIRARIDGIRDQIESAAEIEEDKRIIATSH